MPRTWESPQVLQRRDSLGNRKHFRGNLPSKATGLLAFKGLPWTEWTLGKSVFVRFPPLQAEKRNESCFGVLRTVL